MKWLRAVLPVTVLVASGVAAVPAATAVAAPSWQKYVVAPASRDVRPVRVLSTTGDVTNPNGLLGRGVTTLKRQAPPPKPAWPGGTTAAASSFHAPNNGGNGQPRTYDPGNAVDGNTDTFWNDDTIGAYPDVLTITSGAPVALPGVTVLSSVDGVPQDYTVEVLDGGAWRTAATVTGNTDVQRTVAFDRAVTTTQVRITVTKDQATPSGEFSRVTEVWPGLVADPPTPVAVLDFGKVVSGYPKISFAGASANHPGIRVSTSETQQYLGERSDFSRSDFSGGPGSDQIAVPVQPTVWRDTKGCQSGTQVCADGLRGFRYLRISLDALASDAPLTQASGEVRITGVSLDFTPFLGTPSTYKGWFESSDDALNRYWYNASYTNELGMDTFRESDVDPRGAFSPSLDGKVVLHDGAKRDRDPYVGDVAISGLTQYLTHQDGTAARNVLADLADHQRADGWIPPASINDYTLPLFDYPLWWVTASWDYVLYTGDTGYASSYYANLVKTLDAWYPSVTDAHGLLSKGLNGTGGYGDYAFLPRTGEVTYYNALYVRALQGAAGLARATGHAADADRWLSRASGVAAAVNQYLWDPAAGAYLDSATGAVRHGQDGNSQAIVAGIASPAQSSSSLARLAAGALPYGNPFMDNDTLVSDGTKRVYAFTSYPELVARFQTGQAASAIDQIKRMYGWMTSHDPGITDWEGIGDGGSHYEQGYTSAAHGWSTGVVPALTNELLGVSPTSPGFATWQVAPKPGNVAWARGAVPTPKGALSASWTQVGPVFSLTVTAPRGTSGSLVVPAGRVVLLDGHPVRSTTLQVSGGTHTVLVVK
ncbi:alpha-L-rhamnosidase C-terminal domain-containing protein [Amycolatopsis sp., V23-08]|uniref:Alpha-L-rhamnosidase C-terminal domain-containing protein n=1 Tax=Amycolatopsis heterodermiae TaxID=3110235 RepID=A0ABU5RHJ9_9PSEU|nr:alpha-L-rhamnosidase C-terminal domain-containing protein [Amycolatopsis sp., V23-08]MEA5365745.1 alpha-L-rhamnosidase C-terminal domain-containing protein [Amycolatopsis sp., V23-08]